MIDPMTVNTYRENNFVTLTMNDYATNQLADRRAGDLHSILKLERNARVLNRI